MRVPAAARSASLDCPETMLVSLIIALPRDSHTRRHVRPSPTNPVLQPQLRAPSVLKHAALGSQPPLAVMHSLTSVQVWPSPSYPVSHAQVEVAVLHVACSPHAGAHVPGAASGSSGTISPQAI